MPTRVPHHILPDDTPRLSSRGPTGRVPFGFVMLCAIIASHSLALRVKTEPSGVVVAPQRIYPLNDLGRL